MSSPSNSSVSYAVAWLLLVLAALTGGFWWWNVGRPVAIADAPSARISCVSYAPFRKPGESPLNTQFVITPERIRKATAWPPCRRLPRNTTCRC